MNLEDLNFVELDDEFAFHCNMCGLCCIGREDILLSAYDVYHISRHLKISQDEFIGLYCESYIGHPSNLPIVRLEPAGAHKVCRFLIGHKCAIHDSKPVICALYPLGRAVCPDTGEVKYVLQPDVCNQTEHKIKVSDFLAKASIKEDANECYIVWNQMLKTVYTLVPRNAEPKDVELQNKVYTMLFRLLYTDYNNDEPFLVQLENRLHELEKLKNELSKFK